MANPTTKKPEPEVIEATVTETGLAVIEKPPALGIFREPEIVLQEAQRAAKALMQVVKSKGPGVWINGEQFLEYEDWLTLARFYSMTPRLKSVEPCEHEGAKGWKATVDVLLIPTNQVIGSAEAMCLRDEPKWAKRPSFQLSSMAQTRAGSKALASVLRWVVVLAGFKGTPSVEVNGGDRLDASKPKPQDLREVLNQLDQQKAMPPTVAQVIESEEAKHSQASASGQDMAPLNEHKDWLKNCSKLAELVKFFRTAYTQFAGDEDAQRQLREVYEKRKVELGGQANPEGATNKTRRQNAKATRN